MDNNDTKYTIKFKDSAKKELSKISEPYFSKIEEHIFNLVEVPRPIGCKKLVGTKNSYRIRIADYRVIYTIEDNILTIEVIKIGHRKDVYK